MKKAIWTSFSILCLSFIVFVMAFKISIDADPDVIYVPTDHPTIQEAINAANPGDTIFVKKGPPYYENVVVNKSVSLVGEDRDSTIIDGSGVGSVITVFASNTSIYGFTITNSGNQPLNSGIFILGSDGNNISYNKLINNNDGIYLYFSSNNVISSNVINSNFNHGIRLYFSRNNVVSGNTIYSNKLYGIYLTFDSINNTIYHNNLNNIQQAGTDGLKNAWDYEGEGNFWSDYTGQDLNGDGIGDTSYAIDTVNKDNYPLMGAFSDFNVAWKRETYHVSIISNSTIISAFRYEVGNETGNKIIRFNATGEVNTVGFSRVTIPTGLMGYPFIVLFGEEEIIPTVQNVSKGTYAILYFVYIHSSHTITIISSKTLLLYRELLDEHVKLQIDLNNLNATYYDLLNNYSVLVSNYSQLQDSYQGLNNTYQEHLQDYSESVQNFRNLTYIFVATTAIFIITTIYLSKIMRPRLVG